MDEIPSIVLKSPKNQLCQIVAHLKKSYFISGILPDKLKLAQIVPIHKKDDITDVSNYRPASLLPITVYQKCMRRNILCYMIFNMDFAKVG